MLNKIAQLIAIISCTISPRAPPVVPLSRYSTAARISALASSLSAKFQSSLSDKRNGPNGGSCGSFAWLGTDSAKEQDFLSDLEWMVLGPPVVGLACVVDRPGYVARYADRYETPWLLCKTAFAILAERAVKYATKCGAIESSFGDIILCKFIPVGNTLPVIDQKGD
jgi:hypothetical protein